MTVERKAASNEERELVEKWVRRHHELHRSARQLVFDKRRERVKVSEEDFAACEWGRDLLEGIPVPLASYLRNAIYFD